MGFVQALMAMGYRPVPLSGAPTRRSSTSPSSARSRRSPTARPTSCWSATTATSCPSSATLMRRPPGRPDRLPGVPQHGVRELIDGAWSSSTSSTTSPRSTRGCRGSASSRSTSSTPPTSSEALRPERCAARTAAQALQGRRYGASDASGHDPFAGAVHGFPRVGAEGGAEARDPRLGVGEEGRPRVPAGTDADRRVPARVQEAISTFIWPPVPISRLMVKAWPSTMSVHRAASAARARARSYSAWVTLPNDRARADRAGRSRRTRCARARRPRELPRTPSTSG